MLMMPPISHAGYITIETTTTVTVTGNTASIRITATNKGDEPANNVRMTLTFASKDLSGDLKDVIAIKGSYSSEFTVPIEFKKPGRYPIIVSVEYTDANLYPFSALSVSYLNYNNPANAMVSGDISQLDLADKGKLSIKAKNIDSVERKFNIRLVSSKDFSVLQPETSISVGPGKEKSVSFDIKNISALPGSKYQVFAILSYEDDSRYYSTITSGTINVKKHKGIFNIYLTILTAILAGLVMLLVYKIVRPKKDSSSKDS